MHSSSNLTQRLLGLDYESEQGSVSSQSSIQPFSEAVSYMGNGKGGVKGSGNGKGDNNNASVITRSMSAPLNSMVSTVGVD